MFKYWWLKVLETTNIPGPHAQALLHVRCVGQWRSQVVSDSAEVVLNQFKVLGVGED